MRNLRGQNKSKRLFFIAALLIFTGIIASFMDLDGDGIPTWQEFSVYNTNPISYDSDENGLLDGYNITTNHITIRIKNMIDNNIIHRFDSSGECVLFGERDFNTDLIYSEGAARNQAQFLSSINETEYIHAKKFKLIQNYNWDNDIWSNYFEKEITKTSYYVKNDVHFIFFRFTGNEYIDSKHVLLFCSEIIKIPSENFHYYCSEENNAVNLESAINEVSKIVDSNDYVFLDLSGHGLNGTFWFWNSTVPVEYKWINELLTNITARAIVIPVTACYSGSAIPYLSKGIIPRVILTSVADNELSGIDTTYDFFEACVNKLADYDGNGYVSVREACDFVIQTKTFQGPGPYSEHPQTSDSDNIGMDLYLIDYNVKTEYFTDERHGGPFYKFFGED